MARALTFNVLMWCTGVRSGGDPQAASADARAHCFVSEPQRQQLGNAGPPGRARRRLNPQSARPMRFVLAVHFAQSNTTYWRQAHDLHKPSDSISNCYTH